MHAGPNKIDKDAVTTAVTITVLSALFTGPIGVAMEEVRAYLVKRRGDSASPSKDCPPK